MVFKKRELFYEKMRQLEFHKNKDLFLGIILTIAAWTASALANMCVKLTLDEVAPQTALFFQYFFSFLPFLFVILKTGIRKLHTHNFPLIFARAVFGIGNNLLLFISFKFIPFLDATLLNNTAPLFIPVIMWIWIGKKMSLKQWIPLVIGFFGMAFLINPNREIFDIVALFALISGVFAALSKSSLRMLANESYFTILFYYFLFSALATFPFIFTHWQAIDWTHWLLLLSSAVFLLIAQLAFTFSLKYACAADVAPYNFSFVLVSGIIGLIVWHYIPDLLGSIGMCLIIFAGILAWILERKTPNLP